MVLVAVLMPIGVYAEWQSGELQLEKSAFLFQAYYLSYVYFQYLGNYLAEKNGRLTVLRRAYLVHAVLGFVLFGFGIYAILKVGFTMPLGLGTALTIILMLLAIFHFIKTKD